MDELEVLTKTLNSTIQRHGRAIQAYEIEIANITVELIRLQTKLEKSIAATEEKNIVVVEEKKSSTK